MGKNRKKKPGPHARIETSAMGNAQSDSRNAMLGRKKRKASDSMSMESKAGNSGSSKRRKVSYGGEHDENESSRRGSKESGEISSVEFDARSLTSDEGVSVPHADSAPQRQMPPPEAPKSSRGLSLQDIKEKALRKHVVKLTNEHPEQSVEKILQQLSDAKSLFNTQAAKMLRKWNKAPAAVTASQNDMPSWMPKPKGGGIKKIHPDKKTRTEKKKAKAAETSSIQAMNTEEPRTEAKPLDHRIEDSLIENRPPSPHSELPRAEVRVSSAKVIPPRNLPLKCQRCRIRGHDKSECKGNFVPYNQLTDPCDYCGKVGHIEEECSDLWRSYWPDERSVKKIPRRQMIVACYNCGANDHWGDDCLDLPERLKGKLGTWSCWTKEYADLFIIEDAESKALDRPRGGNSLSYQLASLGDLRDY